MAETWRALVVDDELAIRRLFAVALEAAGWAVTAVESAEQALELIGNNQYDALVVDKNLPRMSGVDVVRELRRSNDTTACVMITAHSSVRSALATMQLGIDAYIEKPFENVYVLVEHIRELVEKRRSLAASSPIRAEQRPLTVLLACGEGPDRAWMQAWFETAGDQVTTIDTLGRLRTRIEELAPDVLVVDGALDAPGLAELLDHVRRRVRLPVTFVLTSGAPTLRMVIDLIDTDVRAVLEKPVTEAQLEERLGETVAKLRGQEPA